MAGWMDQVVPAVQGAGSQARAAAQGGVRRCDPAVQARCRRSARGRCRTYRCIEAMTR